MGIDVKIQKLRDSEAGVSYVGKYNGSLVFVHEKWDPSPLRGTLRRLLWQLRSSENIKELKILPCLGYTCGSAPRSWEYIHRVIYAIPGKAVISLREMLGSKKISQFQSSLSLPIRFEIAQSLARSIRYLHVAEWLHRGIRSSNVLFCSDVGFSDTSRQLDLPYLAGFDYPRSPVLGEDDDTKVLFKFRERQLYRHPDIFGEPTTTLYTALGDNDPYFTKTHDIYGLGVILVELGLCRSAGRLWMERPRDKCKSGRNFRDYLIAELIPEVSSKTGPTYADVALYCLQADVYSSQRPDRAGAVAFYQNVIVKLEKCKHTEI